MPNQNNLQCMFTQFLIIEISYAKKLFTNTQVFVNQGTQTAIWKQVLVFMFTFTTYLRFLLL